MLGKKLTSSFVDNNLGRKLTVPTNSLGTKLVKGTITRHVHNHNQDDRQKKSYLEKR